jgi:hypothetical protein
MIDGHNAVGWRKELRRLEAETDPETLLRKMYELELWLIERQKQAKEAGESDEEQQELADALALFRDTQMEKLGFSDWDGKKTAKAQYSILLIAPRRAS